MIKNDLTVGRTDRGLNPFTESEVRGFIIENLNNIERVIWAMIRDYEGDGELNQLLNPEPSWILEYLYDAVDTQK
jgi:hypothetical protein